MAKFEEFKLDGGIWCQYFERIQQYFVANDIAVGKQVATLLSVIGGQSYNVLRSLISPELPSTKSLDELNKLMKDHMEPKELLIAERYRFHKRDQKPNESIAIIVSELKQLTEFCEFGNFLNDALRDRFVCGLSSTTIQKRLLSEKF